MNGEKLRKVPNANAAAVRRGDSVDPASFDDAAPLHVEQVSERQRRVVPPSMRTRVPRSRGRRVHLDQPQSVVEGAADRGGERRRIPGSTISRSRRS
jgi:hypothetical protein